MKHFLFLRCNSNLYRLFCNQLSHNDHCFFFAAIFPILSSMSDVLTVFPASKSWINFIATVSEPSIKSLSPLSFLLFLISFLVLIDVFFSRCYLHFLRIYHLAIQRCISDDWGDTSSQ